MLSFAQVTPEGMQVLGVSIGAVYGWSALGILVPGAVGLAAMMISPAITASEYYGLG